MGERFRLTVCLAAIPIFAGAHGEEATPPVRYVAPVRLTHVLWDNTGTNLNPALERQVKKTRCFLEFCAARGYSRTVWAIDAFPQRLEDMNAWLTNCLRSFPVPPTVALDFDPEDWGREGARLRTTAFLDSASRTGDGTNDTAFAGILVNYAKSDNLSCSNRLTVAATETARTIEQVRKTLPRTFVWLRVSDDTEATGTVAEWIRSLGAKVDGFFVHRWHPWAVGGEFGVESAPADVAATHKPMIRDGFLYTCPRVRKGLEKDLADYYGRRMPQYEEWMRSRFAGYCRCVGDAIPDGIDPNRSYPLLGDKADGDKTSEGTPNRSNAGS
jgi:hypothetical protein